MRPSPKVSLHFPFPGWTHVPDARQAGLLCPLGPLWSCEMSRAELGGSGCRLCVHLVERPESALGSHTHTSQGQLQVPGGPRVTSTSVGVVTCSSSRVSRLPCPGSGGVGLPVASPVGGRERGSRWAQPLGQPPSHLGQCSLRVTGSGPHSSLLCQLQEQGAEPRAGHPSPPSLLAS